MFRVTHCMLLLLRRCALRVARGIQEHHLHAWAAVAVTQPAFPLVDWSVGGTRNRTGSYHLEVRLRRKAPKKSGGGTRGSRGHGGYGAPARWLNDMLEK